MHLWSALSRSARSSSLTVLLASRSRCLQLWHPHIHLPQQRYISALAERQQDDKAPATKVSNGKAPVPESKDAAYLDFLLSNYGQPEDAPSDGTSKAGMSKKMKRTDAKHMGKSTGTAAKSRTPAPAASHSLKDSLKQAAKARMKARNTARLARGPAATISIRSELRSSAVFSLAWSTPYSKIAAAYDRPLLAPGQDLGHPTDLAFTPAATKRVERICRHMDENPDQLIRMKTFAEEYEKLERELWSETALWLLCNDKEKLMTFLRSTHTMLYPPINWVEDCYNVLARFYDHTYTVRPDRFGREIKGPSAHDLARAESDKKATTRRNFRQLAKTILMLMDRDTDEQFVFVGGWVKLLLPWITHEQVLELWANIKLEKVRIHQFTYLHFTEHFAKSGQIDRSLEALLEAARLGGPLFVDTMAFRHGCSALLRRSGNGPDGLRVTLRLVEHLAGLGLKLDPALYTIIMLNATDAGDLETLQNVYRAMQDQHIEPTKFTCAVRLKACKLDIDNATLLRDVIQEAIRYGDVRENGIVCFEILHCLALHHSKHNPDTAFATLTSAYDQFYDRAPLERLGLQLPSPPLTASSYPSASKPMQPTRHILNIMLWTYLAHNPKAQGVTDMYKRWREVVHSGTEDDQALISCVESPHFANSFLQHFMRSKQTLLQASQVVKDLQTELPASSAAVRMGFSQPGPNIYTWSIFMHGFAARGELKLAEQVLGYMRTKGMEPNVVTWTSLITAYAQKQDEQGLVDVLRRSEQSGLVWNDWTRSGVGRFRNQERLRELLQKQKLEQDLDFSGDLKGGLERRLGGDGEGRDALDKAEERAPDALDRAKMNSGFGDSPADLVDEAHR